MSRRAVPLRSGAATPMARVYERKFNETLQALAKQFNWRVIKRPVSVKARGSR